MPSFASDKNVAHHIYMVILQLQEAEGSTVTTLYLASGTVFKSVAVRVALGLKG